MRPTDAPPFADMRCARCECGRTRREHVGIAEDHPFEPADAWAQRREHSGLGRVDAAGENRIRGRKGVI